jgi:hypothetical protein
VHPVFGQSFFVECLVSLQQLVCKQLLIFDGQSLRTLAIPGTDVDSTKIITRKAAKYFMFLNTLIALLLLC